MSKVVKCDMPFCRNIEGYGVNLYVVDDEVKKYLNNKLNIDYLFDMCEECLECLINEKHPLKGFSGIILLKKDRKWS